MSRIDDALRRAGDPLADSPAASVAGTDTFVSTWTVGDDRMARDLSIDESCAQTLGLEAPADSASGAPVVRPSLSERFIPGLRERLTVSGDADPLLVHQ